MTVAAIGYLRIESTDAAAFMAFGTGVLGLMDAAREDEQAGALFAHGRTPLPLHGGKRGAGQAARNRPRVPQRGAPGGRPATNWPRRDMN